MAQRTTVETHVSIPDDWMPPGSSFFTFTGSHQVFLRSADPAEKGRDVWTFICLTGPNAGLITQYDGVGRPIPWSGTITVTEE